MYSSISHKRSITIITWAVFLFLFILNFQPLFNSIPIFEQRSLISAERSYDLRISGWTFPWDNSSFTSLKDWERELDEVSPYWYYALENGTVVSSHNDTEDPNFIDHCRTNGVKIIPMISNNHDPAVITAIINDSDVRSHHIDELTNIVISNGFKGVDINYENIPTLLKNGFADFISELTDRFHQNNKMVYVSVFPKVSDDEDREGPGAYDYRRLGETADSVRVMAYNLHWSSAPRAGPITAFDWLRTVIDYSVSSIPPHKVSLGIPLFGYDWVVDRKGKALSIADNRSFREIEGLLSDPGIERDWNGTSRTPFLRYSDPSGILHEIDYNDAESLLHELLLVKEYGISRISLWRLGNEDPLVMKYLKRIQKEGISNLPPYINMGQNIEGMKGSPVDLGPVRAYDVDGIITSMKWDLGDGSSSEELEPVHIYKKGGSYDPIFTVIDDKGMKMIMDKSVLIGPFADFEVEGIPEVGSILIFNATISWDLENLVSYTWDMGDGTYYFHSGPLISHAYGKPGDYNIILTVINNRGYTDRMETEISIPDMEDPIVEGGGDINVWEDSDVLFDGRGSYDDSGYLDLLWTFHDGSTVIGSTAVFNYPEPGEYQVILIGTDPSGRSNTDILNVKVRDRTPPEIMAEYPTDILLGGEMTINISRSSDNVGIENITWKLPSGKLQFGLTELTFEPPAAGVYHFTIDIMDSEGNWNSTTIKIPVHDLESPTLEMMVDPAPAKWNETYLSRIETPLIFQDRSNPDLLLVVNVTYRFLLTKIFDRSGIGYMNWSFGDGYSAFGGSVYHNYSLSGEYILSLVVDDIYGNRERRDLTVLVVPTVNFTQNFIQTYQTVYENETNETGKDQGSDLPIITGIAVVVILLLIIIILVLVEVVQTTRSILLKRKEEDDGI